MITGFIPALFKNPNTPYIQYSNKSMVQQQNTQMLFGKCDQLKQTETFWKTSPAEEVVDSIPLPIQKFRKLPKDTPILDIGCGNGKNLFTLADHGYTNLWGVEINPNAVSHAKTKASALPDAEFKFKTVNSTQLPFEADSMGAVIYQGTLSAMPKEDRLDSLKEAYRVLKPGGKLLIFDFAFDANNPGLLNRYKKATQSQLPLGSVQVYQPDGKTFDFVGYHFSNKELFSLTTKAGFTLASQQESICKTNYSKKEHHYHLLECVKPLSD